MFSNTNSVHYGERSRSSVIAGLVASHRDLLAIGDGTRSEISKAFLSTESLTQTQVEEINQGLGSVNTMVDQVSSQSSANGLPLTSGEIENLRQSIMIAQAPTDYLKGSVKGRDTSAIVPTIDGESEVELVALATESFEQHGMMDTTSMTVSYNISTSKQTPAAELFFDTVTLPENKNNYTIDVHIPTVFNNLEYPINGNVPHARAQKHVIKGLRNANIFKSGFTDIIPVYRSGQNDASFVNPTDFPAVTVVTDYGDKVTTNLLKIGEEVNVLALAQTDRQVAIKPNAQDATDQIAPNPRLKTLGVKIGGKGVLFQNLQHHVDSQWTYNPKGDDQGVLLTYDSNIHVIDKDTRDVAGEEIASLAPLKTKGLEALIRLNVSGTGNTDYGTFTVNSAKVRVVAVRKADTKEVIDIDGTDGKEIVALFNDASIDGWALDGNRTNANIREHGLVLDSRVQRVIYGVKLHSPVSILKPVDEKIEVSDNERINQLIQTTFIRRSNAAITTIYNVLEMLKNMPEKLDTTEPFAFSSIGIGQYFIRPYVKDIVLDVEKTIQSLQTSDRMNNVSSVITNFLHAEAAQAFCQSEMAAAYEIVGNLSSNLRPHVIAMADPFTRQFVFRDGDARTLGDGFDFTIEPCSDDRLVEKDKDGEVGTIFMSFGKPRQGSLSLPLYFGECLDKREIPRAVNRSRGSRYAYEIMVQPWYSHIVHLPLLVRVRVMNLKKAVQTRMPFQTSQA